MKHFRDDCFVWNAFECLLDMIYYKWNRCIIHYLVKESLHTLYEL